MSASGLHVMAPRRVPADIDWHAPKKCPKMQHTRKRRKLTAPRSLGNGVRKNGIRNRCPYRRCGVDTEIPYRLPFWREFCLFCQSVWLPGTGVDTEFPCRVRIVDRGVDCRDPVCRHRFRFLEAPLQKVAGDFVVYILEDFAGDFPGGFFWALFSHKKKKTRKNPATKSAKTSGGSKRSAENLFCQNPTLRVLHVRAFEGSS